MYAQKCAGWCKFASPPQDRVKVFQVIFSGYFFGPPMEGGGYDCYSWLPEWPFLVAWLRENRKNARLRELIFVRDAWKVCSVYMMAWKAFFCVRDCVPNGKNVCVIAWKSKKLLVIVIAGKWERRVRDTVKMKRVRDCAVGHPLRSPWGPHLHRGKYFHTVYVSFL